MNRIGIKLKLESLTGGVFVPLLGPLRCPLWWEKRRRPGWRLPPADRKEPRC